MPTKIATIVAAVISVLAGTAAFSQDTSPTLEDHFSAHHFFGCFTDDDVFTFVFYESEDGEMRLVGPDIDAIVQRNGRTRTVLVNDAFFRIIGSDFIAVVDNQAKEGRCLQLNSDLLNALESTFSEHTDLTGFLESGEKYVFGVISDLKLQLLQKAVEIERLEVAWSEEREALRVAEAVVREELRVTQSDLQAIVEERSLPEQEIAELRRQLSESRIQARAVAEACSSTVREATGKLVEIRVEIQRAATDGSAEVNGILFKVNELSNLIRGMRSSCP